MAASARCRLCRTSCSTFRITLVGGESTRTEWLPLLPLRSLRRLTLRRHTAGLPGTRKLFNMTVLDGLDLDLAAACLDLISKLDLHQLLACAVR